MFRVFVDADSSEIPPDEDLRAPTQWVPGSIMQVLETGPGRPKHISAGRLKAQPIDWIPQLEN